MIRVLIIHNNPLWRIGLRAVLEQHSIHIIGETVEPDQILERAALCPDVVLFDESLTWPAYTSVEMVIQLRRAGARGIFVFTSAANEEGLFQFFRSGAAAYELPTLSVDGLVEKIRRVAQGEYLITNVVLRPPLLPVRSIVPKQPLPEHPSLSKRVEPGPLGQTVPIPSDLSEREIEVLRCLMRGLKNKEIARVLKISDQTVKNHITRIHTKLGVSDRTAAVVTALRRGIISLKDAPDVTTHATQLFIQQHVLAASA
jgi:DNA-binding NarL/FixJ family response regulator